MNLYFSDNRKPMDWNFSTTLIGSLPYNDPKKALDMVTDGRISCPLWPQLPSLGYSESMYVQTGEHLPGIRIDDNDKKIIVNMSDYDPTDVYTAILTEDVDYFAHSEKHHKGMYEFLKRDVSKFKAVKGQVTGPISEGLQVQDDNGRAAIYDESYSEIVRKAVNMTARWQVRELSKKNKNVIMFFDEPSLTLLGSPFASISTEDAVAWMNEAMDVPGCLKAIHCCGNTDWPMVFSTSIDILSFDAYSYAHTLAMFPDELNAFLKRGGVLSWGIVPSSDDGIEIESADTLVNLLEMSIDKMEAKGIDRKMIAKQSMLTPQCGLGGVSEENVNKVFDLLHDVSEKMKERYGLE